MTMVQFLFNFMLLLLLPIYALAQAAAMPKRGCEAQAYCGDVGISFPFGIGANCSVDEWFEIVCNETFTPPKPFLKRINTEVLGISVEGGTVQVRGPILYMEDCDYTKTPLPDLEGSPFVFSQTMNRFIAVSCGSLVRMRQNLTVQNSTTTVGGCMSICEKTNDMINATCNGINCCQTAIPNDLVNLFVIPLYFSSIKEHEDGCRYAFLADQQWYEKSVTNLNIVRDMKQVPMVLDWVLYNHSHYDIGMDTVNTSSSYCLTSNSSANSSSYQSRKLQCSCQTGYEGNPYLRQGCQDIDECQDPSRSYCYQFNFECQNYVGGYYCYLPARAKAKMIAIGVCTVVGLLFLLVGAWWLYKVIKKRKEIKLKQQFFKRNGGLLLQQQLSSGEVNVDKIKMFNSKELEKATDHFNEDRMLGQGGQGTVYKGMLTDGRIVAVKKSKVVDEGKLDQFINEVVILSQINHRNVVKILGCCLETEVPLLVYEFIPNGTLFQYLHNQNEEFPLTWDVRLRIATEVAGALSYLHNAASLPIYHRDIKSTNILLDDKYRAKVADFGTSRSIAIDQTHVTTMVQGTFGYLDPEYFQSSQFTEKSDVYSFGVVLVELLTGQKPISSTRTQEARSLATYFILSMEENSLFDILDAQVIKEDKNEEVMMVAKLAKRCLNLNGKKRPTMKDVIVELARIQESQKAFNDSQNYEEFEYVGMEMVEPWDVASTSTGSGLEGGISSSLDTKHLLSTK